MEVKNAEEACRSLMSGRCRKRVPWNGKEQG